MNSSRRPSTAQGCTSSNMPRPTADFRPRLCFTELVQSWHDLGLRVSDGITEPFADRETARENPCR